MRKMPFIIVTMMLLVGCAKSGVPQEDFDRVVADNESLQAEISELREAHESLLDVMNSKPEEEKVQNANASVVFRGEECFGTYSGQLINGQPSGYGRFVADTGWEYTGTFKDGIIDGKGAITFEDDVEYEGTFEDGWLISGIMSVNDFTIKMENGLLDKESALMSMIRSIEKADEDAFNYEPFSKYSHRLDSIAPGYDFIEEHLSEFINANASDKFLAENSDNIDFISFYKDVSRYGKRSWNWDNWEITNIKTDSIDSIGLDYKFCTITMEKGPENFLNGYIIGDNIEGIIDTINIGDTISFNAVPIYSMTVGLDAEQWHDDAVVIAKILEQK